MSEETNTNETKKSKKGLIIGLAALALVVVIGAVALIYHAFSPKATVGSKSVTLSVVYEDTTSDLYVTTTDAEYLQGVMDELMASPDFTFSYAGTDSEYGIMVDTVNDIRADYTLDGAYWSFYVNDEYANYGIAEQPVNDNDTFSIVYTKAE